MGCAPEAIENPNEILKTVETITNEILFYGDNRDIDHNYPPLPLITFLESLDIKNNNEHRAVALLFFLKFPEQAFLSNYKKDIPFFATMSVMEAFSVVVSDIFPTETEQQIARQTYKSMWDFYVRIGMYNRERYLQEQPLYEDSINDDFSAYIMTWLKSRQERGEVLSAVENVLLHECKVRHTVGEEEVLSI